MPLGPGDRLGSYRILSPLGTGGMGEVYRAHDTKLERDVALKVLRPGGREAAGTSEPLLREARAASTLNHPHIATIYEAGEAEIEGRNVPYIAMELVEGPTLAEWARADRRDIRAVVEIAVQAADALAFAHGKGVVHRDVKPSNLVVSEGPRVKVLDFGLARVSRPIDAAATTESSGSGGVAGTLAYMAPEQLRGVAADPRSDVFSFGVVFYEILSGHAPFPGRTPAEVIDAILREEPPPLSRFAPDAPAELSRIVRKMLEKNRERRYQTMREVLLDLDALQSGLAKGEFPPAPGASVAVMTFTNITRDADDDWLGTGIAETVSADLRALPGVTIIGRERVSEVLRRLSTDQPEEELLVEAGRLLGARWIVSGGFQRSHDILRVTARFVEVSTGAVLRTVKIDGSVGEIFALQDRIVAELSRDLCLEPNEPKGRRADPGDTTVVAAYEAYSRGLINVRAASQESLDRAILLFERAVELDPSYVNALLALGSTYSDKGEYLGVSELGARSLEAFRKAAALQPDSAEAWRGIAGTLLFLRRDDEALEAARRAAELAPESAAVHSSMGRVLFIGRGDFAAAAEEYEKALELNRRSGWAALQLAHCRALLSDLDGGRRAASLAIELQEQFFSGKEGLFIIGAHTRMGHLLALGGRYSEAIAEYEKELAFLRGIDHALRDRALVELHARLGSAELRDGRSPAALEHLSASVEGFERRLRVGAGDPFTRYYAACALAMQGESDRALEWLEAAAAARPAYTAARARIEPDLEGLRSDPRFQSLAGMWHDPRRP